MKIRTIIKGSINLTHLTYGILAAPRTPISTPDIGVTIFVNPSPNWNASTVNCLGMFMISENSAIMGIVSAALAEPEGIKIFKKF